MIRLPTIGLTILGLALLSIPVLPQPVSESESAKVTRLRALFIRTFESDVHLITDTVEEEGGDKYYVVTAIAKRSGNFTFRYKFRRVNYGYKFGDNEYHVVVGDDGCKRMLFYGFHPDLCVNDAIVLHFQISDYVVDHSFSKRSRFPEFFQSSYTGMEDLVAEEVDNPADKHMRYLGRTTNPSILRDLRSVAVTYRAIFQAAEPGRFTLKLAPVVPDVLLEFQKSEPREYSIPIVVVSENEPLVSTAEEEHIWESDLAPDESFHPRSSSVGARNHVAPVLKLRTGDRVSLTYSTMGLPTGKGLEDAARKVKPQIQIAPATP
jgi:hypothetical protein